MRRTLVLVAATCAGLVLSAPAAHASGQPATSKTCGDCHKDIYRMWKASAHANAMESDIYQDAYRATEESEGKRVSHVCLKCHAPLAEVNSDWALEQKVTWEGVNCDACHSIAAVDTSGPNPRQVLAVGDVKRGPIRDAASTAHEVAYSELHATSLVCASCHEFTNAEGTPLMTTYSEWKESGAAKSGKHCQTCHMGRTRADVVDPKLVRISNAEVNLHEVPGGHSIDQLNRALSVAVDHARTADSLTVKVRLANRGAGHAVPTGMPGRRVILALEVRSSDGQSFEEKRVYGKFFADAAGQTITRDSRYFTSGVRLDSDTRIRPDERRTESFRFPIPARATAFVTLKLHYEHAPTGDSAGRTWLTFFTQNRTLTPGS